MIFIALMGGVWFAAYTWWNHLYECRVGPLAWDPGKISRALMNTGHAHGLIAQHSDNGKDCGGVLWLVDHYHTLSAFGSYSLLHQLHCVLSPINLGLVHIACYTRSDALHLMLTQKFSYFVFLKFIHLTFWNMWGIVVYFDSIFQKIKSPFYYDEF